MPLEGGKELARYCFTIVLELATRLILCFVTLIAGRGSVFARCKPLPMQGLARREELVENRLVQQRVPDTSIGSGLPLTPAQ